MSDSTLLKFKKPEIIINEEKMYIMQNYSICWNSQV